MCIAHKRQNNNISNNIKRIACAFSTWTRRLGRYWRQTHISKNHESYLFGRVFYVFYSTIAIDATK